MYRSKNNKSPEPGQQRCTPHTQGPVAGAFPEVEGMFEEALKDSINLCGSGSQGVRDGEGSNLALPPRSEEAQPPHGPERQNRIDHQDNNCDDAELLHQIDEICGPNGGDMSDGGADSDICDQITKLCSSLSADKEEENKESVQTKECTDEEDIFSESSVLGRPVDLSDDDDSDDDDLLRMDEMLQSSSTQPKTPFKQINTEYVVASGQSTLEESVLTLGSPQQQSQPEEADGQTDSAGTLLPPAALSLDRLLQIHKQQEELSTMEHRLNMDAHWASKEEEPEVVILSGKQTEMLDHLRVKESSISDVPPGLPLFPPALGSLSQGHLFSCPGSLSLADCGFVPGNSRLDKTLAKLSNDLQLEFLLDDVLELMYSSLNTPNAVFTWAFYAMSIHENSRLVASTRRFLSNILTMTGGPTWGPSVLDMVRVISNYGCPLEKLDEVKCDSTLRLAPPAAGDRDIDPGMVDGGVRGPPLENLSAVLQTVAAAARSQRGMYSPADAAKHITLLCYIALDPALETLKIDMKAAICSLMFVVPESGWEEWALQLCCQLSRLSVHHHNLLSTAKSLPYEAKRGVFLRRHTAFAALLTLGRRGRGEDVTTADLKSFHTGRLMGAVEAACEGAETDYYLQSSVFHLLDVAAGSETVTAADREALHELMDYVKAKIGRLRESIHCMDRTIVKDQMVRLTSKWALMLQDTAVQTTLFGWATGRSAAVTTTHVTLTAEAAGDNSDSSADDYLLLD